MPLDIPSNWVRYQDSWNGFSLSHPPGWLVSTTLGQTMVQSDGTGLAAATILPIRSPKPTPALQVAQIYINLANQLYPGFQTWMPANTPPDAARLTLRVRFARLGQAVEGVLNVLTDGIYAIVSGYSAPPAQLARMTPDLIKILATYHQTQAIGRQTVREASEKAFTFQIPSGWTWQAGLDRNHAGGAPSMQLKTSREPAGIVMASMPSFTWAYTIPMGGMPFFPGGPQVMPLMPAASYIQRIIVPTASQQHPGLRVLSITDRPDLADAFEWSLQFSGIPRGGLDVTLAEMEVAYVENGISFHARSRVNTLHAPNVPQWNASLSLTFRAPEPEFSTWEPVLMGSLNSLNVDPNFLANELRRSQQFIQKTGRTIDDTLRQINSLRQQTSAILSRTAQNTINANDRMWEAGDNVINGVQNVVNSEGQEYKVPVGFDQYWQDPAGNIYGGSASSYPSGYWEPLKPTGI